MDLIAALDKVTRRFTVVENDVRTVNSPLLEIDLTGVPGVTPAMLDGALLASGFERPAGEDWIEDSTELYTFPVGR